MFRELRRKDRKMEEINTLELLEKEEYGVLSMIDINDYGYGVPLSFAYIKGNIYFHSASEGYKLDNLTKNNKVSFCIVGEAETLSSKFSVKYKSVIVFGKITEVTDQNEKYDALLGLIEKYSGDYIDKGKVYIKNDIHKTKVLKMTIEHISGKTRK